MKDDHIIRHVGFVLVSCAMLPCLLLPQRASAQDGVGVRAGVSGSPDQFYLVARFDTGRIYEHLSFRPNLEVGVGNDLTTVSANVEVAYWFPIARQPWSVYVGGGPALNIYRHDLVGGSTTDAQPGFNLLVGLAHRRGLLTELKLGLIDSPHVKFGVGYSWR